MILQRGLVIKKAVLQKRSGLWVSLVMLSDVVLSRLVSNTGVGCHALRQGTFPTQESNPGLLHCRQILYLVSHQGSPGILEWGAYPFSRGSSWPRNWTGVSGFNFAGKFFTSWATREAWQVPHQLLNVFIHIPGMSAARAKQECNDTQRQENTNTRTTMSTI